MRTRGRALFFSCVLTVGVVLVACGAFTGQSPTPDEGTADAPEASAEGAASEAGDSAAVPLEASNSGEIIYQEHFESGCGGFSVNGSGSSASPDRAAGHDVSGSCKLCLSQSGVANLIHDTPSVAKGDYILSVWQQVPAPGLELDGGAKANLALEVVATAGTARSAFRPAAVWTQQEFMMTSAAESDVLRVTLSLDGPPGSCIEFDDVVVRRK